MMYQNPHNQSLSLYATIHSCASHVQIPDMCLFVVEDVHVRKNLHVCMRMLRYKLCYVRTNGATGRWVVGWITVRHVSAAHMYLHYSLFLMLMVRTSYDNRLTNVSPVIHESRACTYITCDS
jgi:hypothetical protein